MSQPSSRRHRRRSKHPDARDWIVDEASEIVAVDLTPQALLNRLARGVVYPMEKAAQAMENFFREPTLAALREMALRQAAHVVDARQSRLAVPSAAGMAGAEAGSNERRERILIHMTDSPATSALRSSSSPSGGPPRLRQGRRPEILPKKRHTAAVGIVTCQR